jgi:hypothetical protein
MPARPNKAGRRAAVPFSSRHGLNMFSLVLNMYSLGPTMFSQDLTTTNSPA